MFTSKYSLEIVSHHPKFKNKNLRKYHVEGIDTVGAWGDEPFEIVFKNNTSQRVEVKLSVDGTDILTGKPATTVKDSDMWLVNGYGTLSLKAWPETNNGGAQFIFTSANNSVAIHTHGDMSSRGIVAAAVFTESHVEPRRIEPHRVDHHHHYSWPYNNYTYPIWASDTLIGGSVLDGDCLNETYDSMTFNSATAAVDCCAPAAASVNSLNMDMTRSVQSNVKEKPTSKRLESLAAVGAGQHVEQKLTYAAGLIKPIFTETVRVRYMWWDDLVTKLTENKVPEAHASGFPGDGDKHNINLGKTPRIGSFGTAFPRQAATAPNYARV
jgi:hypothetical protein